MTFREALREPLLHFTALGMGLFVFHALVAPADSSDSNIVMTGGQIDSLSQQLPPLAEIRAAVARERENDRRGVARCWMFERVAALWEQAFAVTGTRGSAIGMNDCRGPTAKTKAA